MVLAGKHCQPRWENLFKLYMHIKTYMYCKFRYIVNTMTSYDASIHPHSYVNLTSSVFVFLLNQ